MKNFILLVCVLLSSNAFSQEERILEMRCKEMVRLLDDINSRVEENKLITLNFCEESFDTMFFGVIKKNFRSKVVLSTKQGLCHDPKYVESQPNDFGSGVHLGVDYQRKVNALQEFGFRSGDLGGAGGLEGAYLKRLHYPICE